jgi:hypothetical protein
MRCKPKHLALKVFAWLSAPMLAAFAWAVLTLPQRYLYLAAPLALLGIIVYGMLLALMIARTPGDD